METISVGQLVREALQAGLTRITLRLELNSDQASRLELTLKPSVPGTQTRMTIDTSRAKAVKFDLYDAAGVQLAAGRSLMDLRHLDAGEYSLRVYAPRTNAPAEFSIEITPPLAGQHRGIYYNTDRDGRTVQEPDRSPVDRDLRGPVAAGVGEVPGVKLDD